MYRGRFAPSPTGPLHFGSLIAALASYADARANGGTWSVRIEDVDEPRTVADAEGDILATLERYGFRWDGPVVRQSERTARYAAALAALVARQAAYPCVCPRRELQAAPVGLGGEHVYPGTCRTGIGPGLGSHRARAWRVRVDDAIVSFRDRLQGIQQHNLAHVVGDFVVRRSDGLFAYQLAVVVDDADQRITHVVRGADLLASTTRQIFLQRLLGVPVPDYLHVPIAINAAGEKLSKQTRAPALPRAPLPVLLAAWRFLDQPVFATAPVTVAEFWERVERAWLPARLPPVPMLPAPGRV